MISKNLIHELVDKILRIEGEVTLLQEDKKAILSEYKEKIDIKVFNAALRVARIKSKLADTSDAEFDDVLESVQDKINIVSVP
jgi:uncharacterized protein (UPF0335 family)